MSNALFQVPRPTNEPARSYAPGSPERAEIQKELDRLYRAELTKIPLVINGVRIYEGEKGYCAMPEEHGKNLAEYTIATKAQIAEAVEAAVAAKPAWENMPFEHRAAIFLKAADLLTGVYRYRINAATMLGQGKTVHQAELDAGCQLADFLRFNVYYAYQIYQNQPENDKLMWNRLEYRALSGFVLAITPFNFTSICGNLPTAPAIMGNTIVWKPAATALLSNYILYEILEEAGLPKGVINFVSANGEDVSEVAVKDKRLAGFHFTGSTGVFSRVWRSIGENISVYENYPRMVGETGGKDFVFVHKSAQVRPLVVALIRGAFEYQGQKCSAASRAYVPASLWPQVKQGLLEEVAKIKIGSVMEFSNFVSAVIDERSFNNIASYIDYAKASPEAEVLCGGYDKSQGYFVQPTIVQTTNPNFKTMVEEIFGPVLTVYVYEDENLEEALDSCNTATPYALTGAIFANDRQALVHMERRLADAAGNFYINDKPTGGVVGQQPLGGGRASGTNDKAGSILNMLRWVNPRTIKETFVPPTTVEYPFMG
ncbi:MAG: L-glutamate gamma-semialdehyde dehydrogenase [Defluviitaleaceae bacterium]|nr:L-glutamate gamma-semialdehyde dehydrogenase [Defluviitaleaceae bacterium]